MSDYREMAPVPRLASAVECIWTSTLTEGSAAHRVLPDGCADILFGRSGGSLSLDAIGPMTRFRDFALPAGQFFVGIRFRPAMIATHLGVPAHRITDATLPLESLWGARARALRERLAETSSPQECARLLEASLTAEVKITPVQRAVSWMTQRRGCVAMDELASQSGLSPRQLRRVCLEHTGLAPKFLAPVLRFRHAHSRLPRHRGCFAQLALECGYYDQAHLINEFQEFAGRSPAACLK